MNELLKGIKYEFITFNNEVGSDWIITLDLDNEQRFYGQTLEEALDRIRTIQSSHP